MTTVQICNFDLNRKPKFVQDFGFFLGSRDASLVVGTLLLPRSAPIATSIALCHGSRPCTKAYDCFILVRSYLVCLPADSCRQAKLILGCRKGKGNLDDQTSKKTKRELPEFGCWKVKGNLDDQKSKKTKRELPGFGCRKGNPSPSRPKQPEGS